MAARPIRAASTGRRRSSQRALAPRSLSCPRCAARGGGRPARLLQGAITSTHQGRCAFPSWVRSIAFRLALDAKKGLNPASLDPDELAASENPERAAHGRQAASALLRCLAELTERQRLIFLAKHLDGMKGAEIAAEMNAREGTVWATLNQAAANLRQCLNRHGIDRGALH
jgi:RNA polymerase sigma factor (sigma-70 family)